MQKYDPQEPEGEAKRTEQIELLRGERDLIHTVL